MGRLGTYYNIMTASSGGIGIEYLERQPFSKIAWLSRVAEVYLLKRHLDQIYAVNTGYSGEQKSIDRLQSRMDFLTLVEAKTDVAKLKKLKEKQEKKKAKVEKLPGKKRRRVKLKIKDD